MCTYIRRTGLINLHGLWLTAILNIRIETLGASFVRPKLLSQPITLYQSHMQPGETVQQSFLGCPDHLLSAIQYFSLQRDIVTDLEQCNDVVNNPYTRNVTDMLESIRNFDCCVWASSQSQFSSLSLRDVDMLCKLAQSFKIGALIYGRRVLDALVKDVTSQEVLVCALLSIIGELQEDRVLLKCILWPIFIAGLECQSRAQREFLTSCLEIFWEDTNCLNVINAFKILQEYWMREDDRELSSSQWIFNVGHLGRDWLLI